VWPVTARDVRLSGDGRARGKKDSSGKDPQICSHQPRSLSTCPQFVLVLRKTLSRMKIHNSNAAERLVGSGSAPPTIRLGWTPPPHTLLRNLCPSGRCQSTRLPTTEKRFHRRQRNSLFDVCSQKIRKFSRVNPAPAARCCVFPVTGRITVFTRRNKIFAARVALRRRGRTRR